VIPRPGGVLGLVVGLLLAAGSARAVSFARCEAELAAKPETEETTSCFSGLADTAQDREVVARHMRAILARSPSLPWFSLHLGFLEEDGARPAAAEALYRSAAAGFAAGGNVRGEFRARTNLISLLRNQRRPDARRLEEQRAIAIARAAKGDALVAAFGRILEANQLFESGRELHRAYAILQQVDGLLTAEPPTTYQHTVWDRCLNSLGNVASELDLFDEAERYYTRRFELAMADHRLAQAAAARYGIARSAAVEPFAEAPSEEGRAKAIALTRRALEMAETADRLTASEASATLAGLERGAAARAHLDACLRETRSDPKYRGYCLNQRARHFAAAGELDAAREAAEQALDLATTLAGEDPWAVVRANGSAMRVAWARGRRDEAVARGEETLRAIEAIRSAQATSTSQAGLFSTWSDDFYWLSGQLLAASRGRDPALLERAFGVAERLRARTLLDALAKAETAARPAENDTASLELVRRHLAPRETLLSFQVAPWRDWTDDFGGGTWLVVATRDAAPRAYKLTAMGRPDLRREVDRFARLLAPDGEGRRPVDRREKAAQGLAVDLYRKLLAAALGDLPAAVDRLIVVPDDALHSLPFAALRASPGAPPLARRYAISLTPSATLWLRGRESIRPAPRPALALANPPPPDAEALERFREAGVNLPEEPLRYAEGEAASVVRFLGGKELAGNGVSMSSLLNTDLSPFGLLHFAAHALVDEKDPDSSGIWLSPGRGAKRGDGLLRMPEIARLPLDGRAVVLSTCSSAGGKLVRGEGVLSLARAFFAARASAVVASLWPQRDDAAAELFDRFYRHLAEGETLATALAEAQRDRMDAGAPVAAWAGFVVLGDGDLVPLPGGRSWLDLHRGPLALGAAAALLALALALFERRRRRAA
jgi:CHAT domain-containing protein